MANRFTSAITAPIYWLNCMSSVRLASSGSVLCSANILAQLLFWWLRFFQSFQLSDRSCFMVVPAFRSFLLYGFSSFPIVPALWLFQYSDRSDFPIFPAFLQSLWLRSIKFLKGEKNQIICRALRCQTNRL
jgi:hypothetical protein